MRTFRRIMLSSGGLDIDSLPDTQKLYYTATSKIIPDTKFLGDSYIIKNDYNSDSGEGVIVCHDDIKTIDSSVFKSNTTLIKVILPDTLESIENNAFYGCNKLEEIEIPNNVTSIGNSAFGYCSSLKKVTTSQTLIITSNQFVKCELLTDHYINIVDLKDYCEIGTGYNILSINKHLLINNIEITDLNIPNGTTKIQVHKFSNCNSIKSISIPSSVNSIDYSFLNCSAVESVKVSEDNLIYDSRDNCNAIIHTANNKLICGFSISTIPESITTIGNTAFSTCSALRVIDIPDNITNIEGGAFYNCTSLEKVNIHSIETWCKYRFNSADCNPLYYAKHLFIDNEEVTDILIPDTITKINNYQFINCSTLSSVKIEGSLTTIGAQAFANCTSLTAINIPSSVTRIAALAFKECTSLEKINITDLSAWCKISFENAFNYGYWWSSNPLQYANLFLNDVQLTELNIPNDVTLINEGAFANGSFTNITIPDSVTTIKNGAFAYSKGYTQILIPDSVTTIESDAFNYAKDLEVVIIGTNIEDMNHGAFSDITKLTKVYCKPLTPPIMQAAFVAGGGITNYPKNLTIYVPQESLHLYKSSNLALDKSDWYNLYRNIIQGYDFNNPLND